MHSSSIVQVVHTRHLLGILLAVLAFSLPSWHALHRSAPGAPSNYVAGSEHTVREADLDPLDQQVPCVQNFHYSSQLTTS
jgi:hypothetical protein